MAPLALAAGVLSFTSPCALALRPGYISYIIGAEGLGSGAPSRSRAVLTALRFVAGVAVVFTALGATASTLSATLLDNRPLLSRAPAEGSSSSSGRSSPEWSASPR